MIRLLHDKNNLTDSFALTDEEADVCRKLKEVLRKHDPRVSKWIERIWIDERLSDNARAFMIFTMGRAYEQAKGGDHGKADSCT